MGCGGSGLRSVGRWPPGAQGHGLQKQQRNGESDGGQSDGNREMVLYRIHIKLLIGILGSLPWRKTDDADFC